MRQQQLGTRNIAFKACRVEWGCTLTLSPPCSHQSQRVPVHLLNEQVPWCLMQSPRANAMVLQPSVELATVLLSCFFHFPLMLMALEMHASGVQ